MEMPRVPQEMAVEFFTTFRFRAAVHNLSEDCISFKLCNHQWRMSLTEWSVRLGLYSVTEADQGGWMDRELGHPKPGGGFTAQEAWAEITHEGAPHFKSTQSKGLHIIDPILRLAQVFCGHNVLGLTNSSTTITTPELYFMWCMVKSKRVHLGYWLAHACHTIAIRPARHLTLCHILGIFVQNNLHLNFAEGCEMEMCPEPELFDIDFFKSIKVLFSTGKKKMRFYMPGQPDLQLVPVEAKRTEEGAEGSRRAERRQPAQPGSAPGSDWKERVERMIFDLGQNQIAQRELLEQQTQYLARSTAALERMADYTDEYLNSQRRTPFTATPTPTLPLIAAPPAARPEHRSHPTGKRTRSPSSKPRKP